LVLIAMTTKPKMRPNNMAEKINAIILFLAV
jgi:hypothetical protein